MIHELFNYCQNCHLFMFLVRTHIARLSWDQSFISQVLVFIKVLNILDMETVHSFVQPKAEDILRRIMILRGFFSPQFMINEVH